MGSIFTTQEQIFSINNSTLNNFNETCYKCKKNNEKCWNWCGVCNTGRYHLRHCYGCNKCVNKYIHNKNCHLGWGEIIPSSNNYIEKCVYINNFSCSKCHKWDINFVKHTKKCLKTNKLPESFKRKCNDYIVLNYMNIHDRILLCYDCEYENYQCQECETCCDIKVSECSCNDCKLCYDNHISECKICNKNDDLYFQKMNFDKTIQDTFIKYNCCDQYKSLLKNIFHECQYNKNYLKNHQRIKDHLGIKYNVKIGH